VLDSSISSAANSGAATGTVSVRFFNINKESKTLDLDSPFAQRSTGNEPLREQSICLALADVDIFTIAINNGSAIALDSQLIVDGFIFIFIYYLD
jgi:hypothetical protein